MYLEIKKVCRKEKLSIEERFWAKVSILGPDDCWEWTAARNAKGYGVIGRGKSIMLAHRLSYEISSKDSIPAKKLILHRCNNPSCVNPCHLIIGDHSLNQLMAYKDGLTPVHPPKVLRGKDHPNGAKTHCLNGHEFTEESEPGKHRRCKECSVERVRKYRQSLSGVRANRP